jgi:hypothetical protein
MREVEERLKRVEQELRRRQERGPEPQPGPAGKSE